MGQTRLVCPKCAESTMGLSGFCKKGGVCKLPECKTGSKSVPLIPCFCGKTCRTIKNAIGCDKCITPMLIPALGGTKPVCQQCRTSFEPSVVAFQKQQGGKRAP